MLDFPHNAYTMSDMEQKRLIAFRAGEDEDKMLDKMAEMEDRSRSYIIRQSIREAFFKRKLRLNGKDT